ncbi:hypothetical protein STCU_09945 [Strigomonas culicis]|uniref:Uncharacterized protein n=1 Tax=Strigomonas culicis TaxID=28005 RepID=S9V6D5_9TRYP|nr:hypothetical protein STCU_09945 [Strigomonas culicis]|eukprot:EPY18480.1 hypothetical protein STCU_09945 [Strigomonas culicis]
MSETADPNVRKTPPAEAKTTRRSSSDSAHEERPVSRTRRESSDSSTGGGDDAGGKKKKDGSLVKNIKKLSKHVGKKFKLMLRAKKQTTGITAHEDNSNNNSKLNTELDDAATTDPTSTNLSITVNSISNMNSIPSEMDMPSSDMAQPVMYRVNTTVPTDHEVEGPCKSQPPLPPTQSSHSNSRPRTPPDTAATPTPTTAKAPFAFPEPQGCVEDESTKNLTDTQTSAAAIQEDSVDAGSEGGQEKRGSGHTEQSESFPLTTETSKTTTTKKERDSK